MNSGVNLLSYASYADSGEYAEDIQKIVYSNAYKRLAHKTQIIIKPTRDHFRSRLIHTEEVNQIAYSLGRKLNLNPDLISAIAKAHDLGHTPFGHAGERTLQELLEREMISRFGVKLPRSEMDKRSFRKRIFHHSLNSARIMVKEKEFEGISLQVVNGVLNHSWSPWKKPNHNPVPQTYEAQVVAVADQIASINHDTEDIIEGSPYTEYDKDKFSLELFNGFKKKNRKSYDKLSDEIVGIIVDNSLGRGYGRRKRVETLVSKISEDTLETFKKKKNQAK